MSNLLSHLALPFAPLADPLAVVTVDEARFTVLGPRLLRVEYHPRGRFVDAPSQIFWYRNQPVPAYTTRQEQGWLEIETEALRLRWRMGAPFAAESLQIDNKMDDSNWAWGDKDTANLGGTARTLDTYDGPRELEPGLLSRLGWTLVDDSRRLLFTDDGWLAARPDDEGFDIYYFWYGSDYSSALRDYFRIAGPPALVPRWALGNWWSRYWAYTQAELGGLMLDFQRRQVPLSVCIIDMDWHITQTGNTSSGWTGYTWNKELFPDPQGFIQFLHTLGIKTALNLHPADGIHPHEAAYPQMAQAVGVDPESKQPVPFEITDPTFAEAYLRLLHHPQEAIGIDFWWMDWQQGNPARLPGLNLLWWINHLHYYDLGRDGVKRPFLFSRWGGLGNHRYPIGFSGDTVVSWATLAFQPHFTATAANVGYSWWSHDIGGHFAGIEDAELYTRWVQFGVFSPILRLHSTNNPYHERRPWGFDPTTEQAAVNALHLRHTLVPYIYSAAWRNQAEGTALVRPLYHLEPENSAAYACPDCTTFGEELIAAPFVEPADSETRLSRQAAWLPEGDWFDFFDGRWFEGDAWHALYGTLDSIPVFARAGAIVPLAGASGMFGTPNPVELELRIFPGAPGKFVLYEDDGETQAYQQGGYAQTTYQLVWEANQAIFHIHPATGQTALIPDQRSYTLRFFAMQQPERVTVLRNGNPLEVQGVYQETTGEFTLDGLVLGAADHLTVEFIQPGGLIRRDPRTLLTIQTILKQFRLESEAKFALLNHLPGVVVDPGELAKYVGVLSPTQMQALLETSAGIGVHSHAHTGDTLWVLWNNRGDPRFTSLLTSEMKNVWRPTERIQAVEQITPRFWVLRPDEEPGKAFHLRVRYGSLFESNFKTDGFFLSH
jgi:hypothetical protein